MSHVVTVKTQIKDEGCARLAAVAVGALPLGEGVHKLWGGQTAQGFGIKLKDSRFPLVIDLKTGELRSDGDELGTGSSERRLGQFKQAYAVEVAKRAARLQGRTLIRVERGANESVRLVFAA